ncbi:transposase, partial [Trichocoleus sp. FACHB-6]|nr:transposase [Trichocoleus sp. FACHB-832]MBD2061464.1 transposase [Trichocoleus sp. FACHB-6]
SAYSWRFSGARIACFFTSQTPDLLSSTIYTKLDELTLPNHDSGQHKGKRMINGGLALVRATLYMGAVVAMSHNPAIKAF